MPTDDLARTIPAIVADPERQTLRRIDVALVPADAPRKQVIETTGHTMPTDDLAALDPDTAEAYARQAKQQPCRCCGETLCSCEIGIDVYYPSCRQHGWIRRLCP